MSCSTLKISNLEDGSKLIQSKKLKENNFENSNFFLTETKNEHYKPINVQIFNQIKFSLKNGKYNPAISSLINKKSKEAVYLNNNSVYYCVFNDSRKDFLVYEFILTLDEEQIQEYNKEIKKLDELTMDIRLCDSVISDTINPLLTKTKTVQVPYTAYRKEKRSVKNYQEIMSGDKKVTSTATDTTYEVDVPYTAYRYETVEYTVANPNYDPAAAAKAKEKIEIYREEIKRVKSRIDNLVLFTLESI